MSTLRQITQGRLGRQVLWAGLLLTLAAAAWWLAAARAPKEKAMQVELDVFSGRPNPTWTLTEAEGEELFKRLRSLPGTNERPPEPGLGYSGMTVAAGDRQIAGFDSLTVTHGFVIRKRSGGEDRFSDPGRNLERWLLHTGKGRLDEALYSQILKEIEAN